MVRRITEEDRRRVVDLWFKGGNYKEIEARTGVSQGSISSIIEEERRKEPDIDGLRALNKALREANASLPDALRGAFFLGKLNELNIHVEEVPDCIELLSQYGEEAGKVLDSALRLRGLEASLGRTYEEVLADMAEKSEELRKAQQRIEDLRRKEGAIRGSLQELERLKEIDAKVRAHNINLNQLDTIIERGKRIAEFGFTPEVAEYWARELAKRGQEPMKAAATMAKLLSEYGGLEKAVAKLQVDKNGVEQVIGIKLVELNGLIEEKDALLSQMDTLRGQVDEFKNLAERMERTHVAKKAQLEEELAIKQDQVQACSKKLQELEERGKILGEELGFAKIALGVSTYPNELKDMDIGVEFDLHIVKGVLTHIKAKGFDPKFTLKNIVGDTIKYLSLYTEVKLSDLFEWNLNALQAVLPKALHSP